MLKLYRCKIRNLYVVLQVPKKEMFDSTQQAGQAFSRMYTLSCLERCLKNQWEISVWDSEWVTTFHLKQQKQ